MWASNVTWILVCLGVAGCVEQRPGVTKESGSYTRLMAAAPESIGRAAEQVFHDQNLLDIQSGPLPTGWQVVGRNFQDTRITVVATNEGTNTSKVGVNVHPGENEGLSLQILDQIQERLGK